VELSVRPLTAADFESVVALDARTSGSPRRAYFQRRLGAAQRQPHRHLQLAAASGERLVGFVLARKAGGEYGDPENAVVLESFGVEPEARRQNAARRMLAGLEELARERAISVLATQADWREHGILAFFDAAGLELAPRRLFELTVARLPVVDEDLDAPPPLVRNLRESDLGALVRIDERITGADRSDYLRRKVDEALHESAIQVSLVVEDDEFPVGFAMARVDFGDFGHVGAAASLDTIGVDPRFAHKGFATALVAQMIENLAALHVERLETEVAPDSRELQRFLLHLGFAPSQRLSFRKLLHPARSRNRA
jgi:ribosomal protein S18 acetylase RimI-like enzyme